MKKCAQCGEIKPLEQFRAYYNSSGRYYKRCLACESINNRAKYLEHKRHRSDTEEVELQTIYTLFRKQLAAGLSPLRRPKASTKDLVAAQMSLFEDSELDHWLMVSLTEEPETYNKVYEQLLDKYAPIIRIDPDTMLPERDTTHSEMLSKILDRFMAYEDAYYE